MFIFRVVPAASRTCLLISVFAQRPRVWLVRGGCARGRGEFGTACIGLLANDTSRTLKTIHRSLWMDFGWMIEWMNETKSSCRRLLLCLSVSSVVIIKSHVGCIYYSARCVETRQPWPLVRVLLHSSLTSSRVVILFSTDFHMYVLTHVVFNVDVGQELVCNHVTRLLGEKKRR